jgi:YVTN family beta-propeller protein
MRTDSAGLPKGACVILLLLGALACGDSGPSDAIVTNLAQLTLADCDSAQLTATVQKGSGGTDTTRVVRFFSGDTTIITVDSVTGDVATRRPGSTTVRVKAGILRKSVPATVSPTAGTLALLSIPGGWSYLAPGDTGTMLLSLMSCHGQPVASPVFATTDPAVATIAGVSSGARLTAIGYGITGITAQSPDVALATGPSLSVYDRTPLGNRPYGVAISSTGITYVTQADAGISRIDLASRDSIAGITPFSGPVDVAFSPATGLAYVSNQFSGSVGVVDPATDAVVSETPLGITSFRIRVGPGAGRVFVTVDATRTYLLDATSYAIVDSAAAGPSANGIAFHPDGARWYTSNTLGQTVSELSLATNLVLRTFNVSGTVQEVLVSPDGTELYVAEEQSGVHVIRLSDGVDTGVIPGTPSAFGMALSPDGTLLYVTSPQASRVEVVDRSTHTVLRTYLVGGNPRRVAVKADGSAAVVANEGGWVDFLR